MWDFIKDFFMFPIEQWTGTECDSYYNSDGEYCYNSDPDYVVAIASGIGVLLVTLATLALLYWIATIVYRRYEFYRYAQPCQHIECGHQRTLWTSGGDHVGCIEDEYCCEDCDCRHETDKIRRQADNEPKRPCLHDADHGFMEKIIVLGDVIIDKCGICGSVWLDTDEIEKIKQNSYDEGYSSGRSSGSNTGLATGIAIGIATG